MTLTGRATVVVTIVSAAAASSGCTRSEAPAPAPQLQPAVPPAPPPPSPAPVTVKDAAADVGDAAVDATDAGDARRGGARRSAAAPAGGGGGGGVKITGSLSRADGDKVVHAAQGKLRDCAKRSGGKGRVSFKMTVDDRGHVTVAEIPTSSLPGGSEVETCMVHVLRDLRFPRGSGESTISFQMSFGP